MTDHDYGVVYELDATAITTSYQTPLALAADSYASRVQRRRYSVVAALINTTNITAVVIKLQASRDGTNWYDVASVDDADGDLEVEHTYNTIVSHAIAGSFYTDGGFTYLRVAVKVSGGAGQALETLKVSAQDAVIAPSITAAMIADSAVVEAKIADGAVATAKIADAAVTTTKLVDDDVTAAKLDDAALKYSAFTGHSGAGACTLTGALVGDVVLGVANMTDGGDASASFEGTVTVADQIQQSSASNLSAKHFALLSLRRGS